VVHAREDLVVEVGVDEDLHELLLKPVFEVSHDGGDCALVFAEAAASETRTERKLHLGRLAESIPKNNNKKKLVSDIR
jgi:hypothetical protein